MENSQTVHQMTCGGMWSNSTTGKEDNFCARGLEGKTTVGSRRRFKNRKDALQLVREYQAMERETRCGQQLQQQQQQQHDPIGLAQLYSQLVQESARVAQLMANIDAQVAAATVTAVEINKTTMVVPPMASTTTTKSPSSRGTRTTPERMFRRLSSSVAGGVVDCPSPILLRAL